MKHGKPPEKMQAVCCSLSHRNLDELFVQRCPKVGGTFEVCEYEGFPEILQEGKIPRDTSPHKLMYLLSEGSKSHEMRGDRGDTQIPTRMFR